LENHKPTGHNEKTTIVRVGALDGDCFSVTLSSGHTILLELSHRVNEPRFSELIQRGVFDKPGTDGKNLFWPDGTSLALSEILDMVAQSSGKSAANVNIKKEGIEPMKKKKALVIAICGAVAAILSAIVIVIGILDAVERSQYREMGMNTPMVILLSLIFIAGVTALIVGLRKMKSAK
jgi:hypothetical protein